MKKKNIIVKVGEVILQCIGETYGVLERYKGGPGIYSYAFDAIVDGVRKLSNRKIEKKKIQRALKNLEKKEIITLEKKGDGVYVHLKDKKNIKVIKYSLKKILDFKKKEKKWMGKWFMVFFDIPETQKNKRDFLRKFLIYLGFYAYQKSVYIFPYDCKEEVDLIKKIVESAKYMKYIIAEEIEDEKRIKEIFKVGTIASRSR